MDVQIIYLKFFYLYFLFVGFLLKEKGLQDLKTKSKARSIFKS